MKKYLMKNYDNWITERKSNDDEYKGTTILKKEDAIEIIKGLKEFSIDDDFKLVRGIDLARPCYMVDPKMDRRQYVLGTLPTLVMEYQESWQKFPSRMESLFLLNIKNKTTINYGKSYYVIPFDGAKFGVSIKLNYKLSFKRITELSTNAIGFFSKLKNAYKKIVGGYFDYPTFEKNYINKEHYDLLKSEIDEMIMMDHENKYPEFTKFEDADEMLNYYFNADDNDFTLKNYEDLKQLDDSVEIWTDSPCLLISVNMFKKIKKEL